MTPRHRAHPAWPLFQPLGLPLKEKMLPRKVSSASPLCSSASKERNGGRLHSQMDGSPASATAASSGEGDIEREMWESGHSKIVEIQSFLPFHYRLRKKAVNSEG